MIDFEETHDIYLSESKQHFNDREAGFGVLLFIVLQIAVIWVARLLIYGLGIAYTSVFSQVFSVLIESVFAICVYIICLRQKKNFVKCVGLNKKVNGKLIIICVFIAIVCLFGLSQISNMFAEFLELIGYQGSSSSINVETFWQLLLYTFLVALVPAVCEEIMFRGLVLNGLARNGKHLAVIVSALLFMLMHGSPDQTVHQFILGLIFGYIVYYTGNLFLTIIIHFANNFIVLVINYIYNLTNISSGSGASIVQIDLMSFIFSLLISIAIIAIAIYLLIIEVRRVSYFSNKLNGQPEYLSPKYIEVLTKKTIVDARERDAQQEEVADDKNVDIDVELDGSTEKLSGKALAYIIISVAYLGIDWIKALINGILR